MTQMRIKPDCLGSPKNRTKQPLTLADQGLHVEGPTNVLYMGSEICRPK